MAAASSRGEAGSGDGAAVAEQIRIGVHVLGSVVQSSIAADTVLAGALAAVRPRQKVSRAWPGAA